MAVMDAALVLMTLGLAAGHGCDECCFCACDLHVLAWEELSRQHYHVWCRRAHDVHQLAADHMCQVMLQPKDFGQGCRRCLGPGLCNSRGRSHSLRKHLRSSSSRGPPAFEPSTPSLASWTFSDSQRGAGVNGSSLYALVKQLSGCLPDSESTKIRAIFELLDTIDEGLLEKVLQD